MFVYPNTRANCFDVECAMHVRLTVVMRVSTPFYVFFHLEWSGVLIIQFLHSTQTTSRTQELPQHTPLWGNTPFLFIRPNICHYFIHEKCIQNWNKIYVHFMFYETYGKQYLFLVNNSRSFHKLFIFRVQELHTSSLTIVMNFFSQTKHCFFWKIVRSVHFLVRTERWLLRSPIGIKVCLLFRGFRVFSLLFGFDTSEIVDLRDDMTPGSRPATSKFIMDWLRFLFGAANLLVVWCSCPKNSFNMLRRFDWCRHIGQRSTL